MANPIDRKRSDSIISTTSKDAQTDASSIDSSKASKKPGGTSATEGKPIVANAQGYSLRTLKNLFSRSAKKVDDNTIKKTQNIVNVIVNSEFTNIPEAEKHINESFYSITVQFMLSEDKSLQKHGEDNLKKVLAHENIDTGIVDNFSSYLAGQKKSQKDRKTIKVLDNVQASLRKYVAAENKAGRYTPSAKYAPESIIESATPKDRQDVQEPLKSLATSVMQTDAETLNRQLAPDTTASEDVPVDQKDAKTLEEQPIPINQEQYNPVVDSIIFPDFNNYSDTNDLREDINHKFASVTTELMISDNKKLQKQGFANLESIIENRNTNKIIISNFYNYLHSNHEILAKLKQNNLQKKVNNLLNKARPPQDYSSYAILNKTQAQQLIKHIIRTDINILKANPELQQVTNEQIASITTSLMAFPDAEYSKLGADNLVKLLSNEYMNTAILENFYSYVENDGSLKKMLKKSGQLDNFYELCHQHEIGTGKDKIPDYTELKTSEAKVARNEALINIANKVLQKADTSQEALDALNKDISSISLNLISLADEDLKQEGIDSLKQIVKRANPSIAKSIYNFINNSDTIAKKDKKEINKIFVETFQFSTNKKLDLITQNFINRFHEKMHHSDQELKDIHSTENYMHLNALKRNFITFNQEIKQEYIDNLTKELQEINDSGLPFDLKDTRTFVTKQLQNHYQGMMHSKIYNSLLSPKELSDLIRDDLNNGFIASVLDALGNKSKADTNKIQTTVNEILHNLDDRQKLIAMAEAYQNTSSVLDEFNTAFNNSFSDIYELDQIQHEIQSAKIQQSSLSSSFFSRIVSLFKRIKNYFISSHEIANIKTNSKKTAEISKRYAENLELFKDSIAKTNKDTLTESVIDEMAHTYIEQQEIINFEKNKLDMSFYNKETINTISKINEKLTEQQKQEFNKVMQDISMSIIDHQQHFEQPSAANKSSAIFLYAFNKALELVNSHKLEGSNINIELKNRFIQICNQLNKSHINLDDFGFKNGIQVDKLTDTLHSTYQQPAVATDNNPVAPITPQAALEELSNLNTEVRDSTLNAPTKSIFSSWVNSISSFVTKKINKTPK